MTQTNSSRQPLLSIRDLSIALPAGGDRAHAVKDISYDLHAGEILCIVGESGSGKSMSANAIMGLLPSYLKPERGEILFQGRDLLKLDETTLLGMRGKDMAMVFQEPLSALNPVMTVGDQIAEVMRVHRAYPGEACQRRVLELLEFVGLPDPATLVHSYPFRLSGGQRQRVVIAMALALEPTLLIADEPTTALDVTTQAQILALIRRIQAEKGMGVMFVTHDFGVVAEIADRVAVMEKGVLVEIGTAQQVLNHPQHPYTRRLISAVPHGRARDGGHADDRTVLDVRNLRKTYVSGGGLFSKKRVTHAVDDVSFSVKRGETLGIVGESGSGKSTIGKCLLRLTGVDGGQMLFDGQDIARLSERQFRPMRRDVQMIFQDPFASLNPRHTVGRIITDGPVATGVPLGDAQARARELLQLVGLEASAFDRYPNQFSGGQRQRIGIARALALEPKLLVADESVSALDVSVQAQVLQLLADLQKRLDIALIFITHDLRVAAQICHQVIVMHRGRVVEAGPPSQIFDDPQHDYTRRLIDAIPGKTWDPTLIRVAA
ncbi:peptide/nickel transport system ATP-binding protein [Cupriavidus metallidurans]|jgi:peptide/nickel transport system ATP-binding protein|uniref:Peptide transport fused subunits of ABC superfamily: ATP-binding components n=1 Tax=Cupriavidus metallidurans (strain ATCC 43123 / DSM 2839 / NBRC 102507 / CH34) TaxID=266264 RepID=Q1LMX6_CUPMC|nr:ABC transporter ATP-binding protein [Cupriavidus metallidurans]ABF08500.1 putative peptide transport fused subunits of ABC superfamily: ATP-binding components [Cupriavidus metallidurans CH34]AVA33614.1 ABC transporter ATP-binding protein [Cupriavidus metallidurans]MDE4917839.1 ABC transporter ATP-binding protein [Cupriavidus metallidurans]QGS30546.1 dipeptide ABC transporter ATP-binding protein [Cupriavidus metallidurans]